MKALIKKMIETRSAKLLELQKKSEASESVDEVRAIGIQIEDVKSEISSMQTKLNEIETEERAKQQQTNKGAMNVRAAYGLIQTNEQQKDDGVNSVEYRTAFMNLVTSNIDIPSEVRANANTKTTDVASVIPTVLLNQIIEKMDEVGMILPLITRTSYAAGVVIPTSTVKPVATWVAEGGTSDRQKKTTGKITFSYFKLRCEISMSMEVGTMALSAFEAKFVENVVNAMTKAIEEAIIKGNGTSSPKGILTETPNEGNAIKIAKAKTLDYKGLCEIEGRVPAEYENTAVWLMSKATFMSFTAITDSNGQPIARVNYGIGGKPERILLGRTVVVNPYFENYSETVAADTIFAAIFDLSDYVLNSIYDMGISKKQDWDTEDMLTKAVMSVDGKAVSKDSLITLTKTVA